MSRPSISPRSTTRASTASGSGRSFFARTIIRRNTSGAAQNEQEGSKGPMGLTTLYEPENDAVIDIIFVHGLNGGSQSTWSKGGESTFWPREWLPYDDAFNDVRIHTFGYSSSITRDSVLNIQDFANNLLAFICHSPVASSNELTPIIFVGHSMGGLVIKKACVLAHQHPEYEVIAKRVSAVFFLATPHQGAGIAQLLHRVLALTPGSRPFVTELAPQSSMLQSINEEFPRYSAHLKLFSFYETQPMYYGIGKGLIVEKNCAVMNSPNEQRTYLDANHRDVARFTTPNDPSYTLIRNALATTIASHRVTLGSSRQEVEQDQTMSLIKFLGVPGAPEDDLMTNESHKFPGSCQWLIQKNSFQQWRDAMSSKIFWLWGLPGSGKSVLASHVIDHLRTLDLDCSYFFFTDGDKSKNSANAFLRSLAWQMAILHPEILSCLAQLCNDWGDTTIDKVDYTPVWRRVFASGILKVKLDRPQYWIIDALDECTDGIELIGFLKRAQEMWPLCILVTSRTPAEKYITTSNSSMEVVSEAILEENKCDIADFLDANLENLPGPSTRARQDLADQILQSSSGCFLWVNLVLRELRQVHTSAEISQVLSNNSSDMDAIYSRVLDDMARARFGKDLTKSILTWTASTFRPLSVEELHYAIENDIGDSIDNIPKSISTCCSNLVYIDKLNKVQLIHLTAREYLTRKDIESEFAIEKSTAHERLAIVCMKALSAGSRGQRKGSKLRRSGSDARQQDPSPLQEYASTYMFQHLLQIRSTDTEVFFELAKFLSSQEVLAWIERLASNSDLQRIYQAGKNCLAMINRRAQHSSPIGIQKQIEIIDRWGNDFLRLVNKFGKQLSHSPSSIHYLIPPFCPPESALRKQFVNTYRGLSVQGLQSQDWDDCLSTVSYPRTTKPADITSSQQYTAVALSNGHVVIYDNKTLLETHTLVHGETICSMAFGQIGKLFATGGPRRVRVWALDSSSEVINFTVPAMSIALGFMEDDELLAIALKNNSIMYWDISDNIPRDDPIDWTRDLGEGDPQLQLKRPTMAAFSIDQDLLAIIYRGEYILLWSLSIDRIHDMYEKETGSQRFGSTIMADGSTTVWSIAFSTTAAASLLVASYSDGDVVIYDTDTGEPRGMINGINALCVACSPDGRTLATADSHGSIHLFDLRTRKFIYKLSFGTEELRTKRLYFTPDNLRLLDIRGNQFRVWDPTVLLRQEFEDANSDTVSVSTNPREVDYKIEEQIRITAIACIRSTPGVFCGKEDGSVHVYDIVGEPCSQQLFTQTEQCAITTLHFDEEFGMLTCCDVSSRITCRKLTRRKKSSWDSENPVIDLRSEAAVSQILTSGKQSRLLVSTERYDTTWSLLPDSSSAYVSRMVGCSKPRWLSSPMNPELLLRFESNTVSFHRWDSLEKLGSVTLVDLTNASLEVDSVITFQHQQYFATKQYDAKTQARSTPSFHLWDFRDFVFDRSNLGKDITTVVPALSFNSLKIKIDTVLGVSNDRAVFLSGNNWIYSADIDTLESWSDTNLETAAPAHTKSVRHFFIPDDWASLVNRILIDLRRTGEIVLVKQSELAVIRRGLEVTEKGAFNSRRTTGARQAIAKRPGDKRHLTC